MNRTTVKRGIGAVILALIAAALLAFLLKDKAAQRQDVVDMALPGSDGSIQDSNDATRLPQLSTDNSGNGTVIATAGQDNAGDTASTTGTENKAGATLVEGASEATDKVIASAAAVGTSATAAVSESTQTIDFNVKAPQKNSGSLDLVNNGEAAAPASTADTAANTTATAATQEPAPAEKPDQGTVIASTTPRQAVKATTSQARLIDERRTAAPKSARTAQVITKSAPPAKPAEVAPTATAAEETAQAETPAVVTGQAKNGYAIQLLATSSLSRANDLKKVMIGEGYPTYTTKVQQNGKLLYRVRIGQYSTRAAAAKEHNAMKRRYKKNADVNRSAIVAR